MSTTGIAAPVRAQNRRVLVAALVATVVMLFTAFAAAYLEHQGAARAANKWSPVALPGVVWINTAILAFSSVLAEVFRQSRRRGLLWGAMGLGLVFLGGQVFAWLELRRSGVYLPTNSYASFFYILTIVHAAHIALALVALATAARRPRIASLCVGFWHFLGVVWIYVLFILKGL